MPYWNPTKKPTLKHVPQPQFELEMPERAVNEDIDTFLKEKGWTITYQNDSQFYMHRDFSNGPQYYEWFEAVAMEMIRFMRIGVSA